MLVHVPGNGSGVYVASIMRDTWVEIPGDGSHKINAAFAYGGVPLAVLSIETLLDTRIDHVAAVDMEGFKGLTDALGGVEVDVPVAFDASQLKGHHFAAGEQSMNGEQALAFVRERKAFVDGDYQRVRDQQVFLKALLGELTSLETPPTPARSGTRWAGSPRTSRWTNRWTPSRRAGWGCRWPARAPGTCTSSRCPPWAPAARPTGSRSCCRTRGHRRTGRRAGGRRRRRVRPGPRAVGRNERGIPADDGKNRHRSIRCAGLARRHRQAPGQPQRPAGRDQHLSGRRRRHRQQPLPDRARRARRRLHARRRRPGRTAGARRAPPAWSPRAGTRAPCWRWCSPASPNPCGGTGA